MEVADTLLAAAVMHKLGERSIVVSPSDVERVVEGFEIETVQGGDDLAIRLVPKADPAQQSLPLAEAASGFQPCAGCWMREECGVMEACADRNAAI